MRYLVRWTFVVSLLITAQSVYAQTFFSEADSLITIRTMGVLPAEDNAKGIYSRAIENHIKELVRNNHHFDFVEVKELPNNYSNTAMLDSSTVRQEVFSKINTDALIVFDILKKPSTMDLKLSIFLAKDTSLILQKDTQIQKTEIESVKDEASKLLQQALSDLPYQGLILSRQGTKVTINLGKRDGIQDNQVLSVVQILKLNRHPKFNFLISSEKETIGKVKVLKVDETLSFGRVVTEKESGIIQVFSKISGLDAVNYKNINSLRDGDAAEKDPNQELTDEMTYGQNPNAWLPSHRPTFGKLTGAFGLGYFTESVTRSSDDDLEASGLFPFFSLRAEAWITSQWSAHIGIRQGMFEVDNPEDGGSPGSLNHRLSSHDLMFGYNFRLGQLIDSPKIEILFGYANYRMYSDASTPATLTTKEYSGFKTGVTGSYPMAGEFDGSIGAELFIYWFTDMSESPSISGDSDNDITQFSLFIEKNWKTNLRFRYAVDFELYNSNFTGASTTSSSQKLTNVSAGLAYYF